MISFKKYSIKFIKYLFLVKFWINNFFFLFFLLVLELKNFIKKDKLIKINFFTEKKEFLHEEIFINKVKFIIYF